MRFWFDTEFIEDGKTIELISIGVVAEDGRRYYAENSECDLSKASDWVKQNVLPHLRGGKELRTREQIADDLIVFMGKAPEVWAYYADYDWVVLCQLFGTMMNLPEGWPMFCRDIKQLCLDRGNPQLPEQPSIEHHALEDAEWAYKSWRFLSKNSINDIIAERQRHVDKEGWSSQHDDGLPDGELEQAAACYSIGTYVIGGQFVWPWSMAWWKPGNRRRMLVKAGALIVAAIDKIDRKTGNG